MKTDAFHKFSIKYALDSEIVATFCESFVAHVDLPKKKWYKFHSLIEENCEKPNIDKDGTVIYNVDPIVLTAYIEKPHFPVRIKEHE